MTLGKDIGGVEDVDRFLSMVDGPKATAQAVLRSLNHSPGVLWWAPDRGANLTDYLHLQANQERIERRVQVEAEADERVEAAEVTSVVSGTTIALTINLTLDDGTNTLLTVTIDQLGSVLSATIG